MDLQSLKPNTDSNDAASPISKITDSLTPENTNNANTTLPSINPLEALGTNNKKNFFSKFQDNKVVEGSKDFLTSNTAVAKISFLLLIVLLFTILLRIGSKILTYIIMPKQNPYAVKGLKDGKKMVILEQNPAKNGSVPIFRSDNKRGGIEFTYSLWLNIDSSNQTNNGKLKHIFHKGHSNLDAKGMAHPLNAPGVYYDSVENKLVIAVNSFKTIKEEIMIDNIPLNKWFHLALRCRGKLFDTYINGTIVNRHKLNSVIRQNYGNLFVNMNGGFSGTISNLRYFSKAKTGVEINNITKLGPNMKADKSNNIFPPYLSLRWYFDN